MKQTIKVHKDNTGTWQPSKYVSKSTPIKLDTDKLGTPQDRGTARVNVRAAAQGQGVAS